MPTRRSVSTVATRRARKLARRRRMPAKARRGKTSRLITPTMGRRRKSSGVTGRLPRRLPGK